MRTELPPTTTQMEYWTAERVRSFDAALRVSTFPLQVMAALRPVLRQCRTALDVGAGVGALTIPLARRLAQVTALEPSGTMRDALQQNIRRARRTNITVLNGHWGEPALNRYDLVLVANVAPIFDRLASFIAEVHTVARRAVALVQNVGPGTEKFYYGELYPLLLGRPYPRRRDYLRSMATLHAADIYANVQIIEYRFDQPFDTMADAVAFWTAQMRLTTPEQQRRLRRFLSARLVPHNGRLLAPMPRKSAVLWWPMPPRA